LCGQEMAGQPRSGGTIKRYFNYSTPWAASFQASTQVDLDETL
jgi:hypothetical protein